MISLLFIGIFSGHGLPLVIPTPTYLSEPARRQDSEMRGPRKETKQDAASVTRMQSYGRCVAQRQPAKAAAVLQMDFNTPEYRRAISKLAISEASCMGRSSRAQFASVLFAGALAEQLLTRNEKLAKALIFDPGKQSVKTFSQSDYIAACVARTSPEKVVDLFATRVATDDEKAAMNKLMPVVQECVPGGQQARFNLPGLRAILATASYRMVEAGKLIEIVS